MIVSLIFRCAAIAFLISTTLFASDPSVICDVNHLIMFTLSEAVALIMGMDDGGKKANFLFQKP